MTEAYPPRENAPEWTHTETDSATVQMQIEAGVAERGVKLFLNNFPQVLPGGAYRTGEGLLAEIFAARLDQLMVAADSPARAQVPCPHGERALQVQVTWRTYFEEVDATVKAAVEAAEIDPAELERLQQEATESHQAQEQLAELALPIYERLRMQGYGHRDLVS